jgi:hypothetical protein
MDKSSSLSPDRRTGGFMNEWFVALAFMVFIGALLWVTVEAVTHSKKSGKAKKENHSIKLPNANKSR